MRVRSLAHSALSFLVLSPLALASPAAATHKSKKLAADNPDDPTGKLLYITEPACGFYRCVVTWSIGSTVDVNWLGPPAGNVQVSLASNIGGPQYVIASSIQATSQEGYCDSGYGLGVVAPGHECGRVQFVVPADWKQMSNYTIVVQSLSDSSIVGYTDMITIAPYNASSPSAVPSANIPSGTQVSLLTIPAPTSTNAGVSTPYTGQLPAPTAVSGAAAAASSAAASSSAASSSAVSTSRRVLSTLSSISSGTASAARQSALSSLPASASSAARTATSTAASASHTGAAPAGPLLARTAAALSAAALGFALFA